MKRNSFIIVLLLSLAAFVASSCSMEEEYSEENLIVGSWFSTEESVEITIAGSRSLPEGTYGFIFDGRKVEIYNGRYSNPERYDYRLVRSGDTLWLHIINLMDMATSRVVELTDERLVLEDDQSCYDWGYHLVLRRGYKQEYFGKPEK